MQLGQKFKSVREYHFHFKMQRKIKTPNDSCYSKTSSNSTQVQVAVSEWKVVQPVTIDRVGVYFRHADMDLKATEVSFYRLLKKSALYNTFAKY